MVFLIKMDTYLDKHEKRLGSRKIMILGEKTSKSVSVKQ